MAVAAVSSRPRPHVLCRVSWIPAARSTIKSSELHATIKADEGACFDAMGIRSGALVLKTSPGKRVMEGSFSLPCSIGEPLALVSPIGVETIQKLSLRNPLVGLCTCMPRCR